MIALIIILALMIPLLAVVLDSQLGRALAARLEKDKLPRESTAEPRIEALEAEVDRLVQEVKRLDEESRFVQRLLENREPPSLPPAEPRGGDG